MGTLLLRFQQLTVNVLLDKFQRRSISGEAQYSGYFFRADRE